MVQFMTTLEAIKRPDAPPVCPKCGSHRTEVIGSSDDPAKRILRCNACGAISTVPVSEAASLSGDSMSAA